MTILPIQVEVWYGKHSDPTRHMEVETVYLESDKECEGFPKFYIRNENIAEVANIGAGLRADTWIETYDGYIVRVIKSKWGFFRIPKGGTYRKWSIAKGSKIYFHPTKETMRERQNCGGGTKLTEMQQEFCWNMAKRWNIFDSYIDAGFSLVTISKSTLVQGVIRHPETYIRKETIRRAKTLLGYPKIRKGIMKAIQIHLQAMELSGEDFVLKKQEKLMKTLQDVTDALKGDVLTKIQKQTLTAQDVTLFTDITTKLSEEIKEAAKWVGYGIEGGVPDSGSDNSDGWDLRLTETKLEIKANLEKNVTKLENLEEVGEGSTEGLNLDVKDASFINLIETQELTDDEEIIKEKQNGNGTAVT